MYCNNTQMTSERVKNKKSRHSTSSRAVLFSSLHTMTSSVYYYSSHARKNVIYCLINPPFSTLKINSFTHPFSLGCLSPINNDRSLNSILFNYYAATQEPELWNEQEVTEWLLTICQKFDIDEEDISLLKGYSGQALDSLEKEDWIDRSPGSGTVIFKQWQKLKETHSVNKEEEENKVDLKSGMPTWTTNFTNLYNCTVKGRYDFGISPLTFWPQNKCSDINWHSSVCAKA